MQGRTAPPILIVDDESEDRQIMARALEQAGYGDVARAESAQMARRLIEARGPFALLILNIRMPGESGLSLLEELAPKAPQTVVIMETSGHGLMGAISALKMGAYDYVLKPFDTEMLQLSVGVALKRRQRELEEIAGRRQAEDLLQRRVRKLEKSRSALLQAICRMAEFRDPGAHGHPVRVAQYARLIAEQLARGSAYAPFLDGDFMLNLPECAMLHDLGKLALPTPILLKAEELTPAETSVLESHTTVGREICLSVRGEVGEGEDGFIEMAADVTAGHHERWDGDGYPEALAGARIPLSARIVTLADYWDIWRTPMTYRPEVTPAPELMETIEGLAGRKFDPIVVAAFRRCRDEVDEVERSLGHDLPTRATGSR